MQHKRLVSIFAAAAATLALALTLSGCATSESAMVDGYYTAEQADFDDHGWKEYITINIKNNKIVTVEYNAKNKSGFIKSWDMEYMRTMNRIDGNYPNKYTRAYVESLLSQQDPARVDAQTGATNSYGVFKQLAAAAIAQAKTGDKSVAFVPLAEHSEA
jgi:major membrane immunogen (membrane-anchored lipoprotein)